MECKNVFSNNTKISQRYTEYERFLKQCIDNKDSNGNYKYPQLRVLSPSLDGSAKSIYATFLRLTRNELAHSACVKMDRMESLIM